MTAAEVFDNSGTGPIDQFDSPGLKGIGIEDIVRQMLDHLGEDPDREGLVKTPARVDRSMAFLTAGYRMRIDDVVGDAIFHEQIDDMVIVKDIEFYSMCEHHMLPFFGQVHVAYIPNGKVIGLSKLPRIVEMFSRRLQLQERMTRQIAKCIEEVLEPKAVCVISEARHLCMMMRGIQKQQSSTISSAMLGEFRTKPKMRIELMGMLENSFRR
ncbi:MAG: GTP cyclohydrolase I FolE [Sumerlaeia bacterium]